MRAAAALIAAVFSLQAAAEEGAVEVPKAQLQLLSVVVGHIHDEFAGPVDDARLAGACAQAVREKALMPAAATTDMARLDAVPALLVRAKHAASPETSYADLTFACAKGMAAALDKRSSFLGPDDFRELRGVPSGGFAALGLELAKRADAIVVVGALDDTPAQRAGIRPGDRLISIDGVPLATLALDAAAKRLRGRPGTPVTLVIERPGERAPIELVLRREIIRVASAKAEWQENAVLLVRIARFANDAHDEVVREIARAALERTPEGLLVDLRGNTGGVLPAAVEVASLFLEGDALVGELRGRVSRPQDYRADRPARRARFTPPSAALALILRRTPMVVLVDERTASGAEIVAAALQANRRAPLVGTRTFGTGSIQTIIPLGQESALRLTTHYWYAPGDRKLEDNPLQPDVAVAADAGAAAKLVDAPRARALELLAEKQRR